jgi:hypothetical protein
VGASVVEHAIGWVILAALIAPVVLGIGSTVVEARAKAAEKARRDEAARHRRIPGTAEWTAEQERVQRRAAAEREQLARELRAREEGRSVVDWKSAERAAAWFMENELRLWNVRLTPPGADGGVDVLAKGIVAQVKCQTAKVGRAQIQQLKGAAGRRGALFFAVGDTPYSRHAIEWADENGVGLFSLAGSGKARAVNRHSRAMRRPGPRGSTVKPGDPCPRSDGVFEVKRRRVDGVRFLGCSAWPGCPETAPYPAP